MAQELFDSQDWIRAADRGDAEAVERLLAAGADVDARTQGSETALMRAAARGHAPLVRTLLARGADPNLRRRDGWTALMLAAFFGHAETARELLRRGADADAADRNGSTALKWASSRGHVEVALLLSDAPPAAAAAGESPPAAETRKDAKADAPRPAAPAPERAPEISAVTPAPPSAPTTSVAATPLESSGAAREESDEVTIAAAAVRSPAATKPAAPAPARVFAPAHTTPAPAHAPEPPAASIFERAEGLSAEKLVISPEVRREVTAAAARAERGADGGARFWRAAALGMALLAVGGAALAYRFGGAGAPSASGDGARPASTPEATAAQPVSAAPAETQPAVPVTPIASPLPADPAALGAGAVGLTPGTQPSVPTYFPPAGADASVPAPPVEGARPRETYPVNQPAGRAAGGEPAVVNLGNGERTAGDAPAPTRRPQDSAASEDTRGEAPTTRPARDESVQRSARPARTADASTPAPTPKGKVVNWP